MANLVVTEINISYSISEEGSPDIHLTWGSPGDEEEGSGNTKDILTVLGMLRMAEDVILNTAFNRYADEG